jgi:hypothetical protein
VDYSLTEHARRSLARRTDIRIEWLERALRQPDRVTMDEVDPELEHRLLKIEEYGGRVLRVIVKPGGSALLVVTAFFDRRARKDL